MKQKKKINIMIGTNNQGKLREIKDLLPKDLIISSPKDLKIKSPKENGRTFKENSLIKAKYFSKKSKMMCLADDSGLEIDILNKKPGIHSARWAGKNSNFKKAISKVYEEIEGFLADAQLEFAHAAISELLEKNAEDVEALVFNARLLGSTGQSENAMSNLNKALSLDASHILARTFKAAILYDTGSYDDAESMLNDVLKVDDTVHAAWFNLARCQARKEDFETANVSLDKALKGDGKNAHCLFAKSNVMEQLGHGEEAFEILKASVEANPTLERGWYVLCFWLLEMDQAEEAIHNLKQAVELVPDSLGLQELLGRASVESGQTADAIKLFGELLDKNPENAGMWFNYGAACLAGEQFGDAEVAFRKAVELDPEDLEAIHELANLIQLSGDPQAATEAEAGTMSGTWRPPNTRFTDPTPA